MSPKVRLRSSLVSGVNDFGADKFGVFADAVKYDNRVVDAKTNNGQTAEINKLSTSVPTNQTQAGKDADKDQHVVKESGDGAQRA